MSTPEPRIVAPDRVAPDEVFLVRTLITHQMETGLRQDAAGISIPRKIINRFVCAYDGAIVFEADFYEAMAANPYLEFHVRATRSGLLELTWHEDGGAVFTATKDVTVA